MKCPTCKATLVPWYWQDGGTKGVTCDGCDVSWWSDTASTAIDNAAREAGVQACVDLEFPQDAIQDDLWKLLGEWELELWGALQEAKTTAERRSLLRPLLRRMRSEAPMDLYRWAFGLAYDVLSWMRDEDEVSHETTMEIVNLCTRRPITKEDVDQLRDLCVAAGLPVAPYAKAKKP